MRGLVIAAIIALLTSPALGHDHWISQLRLTDPVSGQWCCNRIDCAAVPAGGVYAIASGYAVAETGETISATRVIWKSQDGRWWRCRNLATNETRCLIGPPPGS